MGKRWAILTVLVLWCTACGEDRVRVGSESSGGSPSVGDELAATGVGDYLGTIYPDSMQPTRGWEEYRYDGSREAAVCLQGTDYLVSVRRGTTNQVLLYLEGGGACWDATTCALGLAKPTANGAAGDGILNFNNAANPFRDWSVVFASYCDGSVFSGNNIVDYAGRRTYHHGIKNLSAAITLMQREFPDPQRLVVSGSSAGGYGTFMGYAVSRVAYPDTPILVFNDSGPGLQNPNDSSGVEQRDANWKYLQYVPASCTDCADQLSYLSDWAMDRDPRLRTALFSYLQDMVIRSFLTLSGPQYEAVLRATSDEMRRRKPDRFKRFFKRGAGHTVLGLPNFYTLTVDGTNVRDWTADFLADGPAWRDLVED